MASGSFPPAKPPPSWPDYQYCPESTCLAPIPVSIGGRRSGFPGEPFYCCRAVENHTNGKPTFRRPPGWKAPYKKISSASTHSSKSTRNITAAPYPMGHCQIDELCNRKARKDCPNNGCLKDCLKFFGGCDKHKPKVDKPTAPFNPTAHPTTVLPGPFASSSNLGPLEPPGLLDDPDDDDVHLEPEPPAPSRYRPLAPVPLPKEPLRSTQMYDTFSTTRSQQLQQTEELRRQEQLALEHERAEKSNVHLWIFPADGRRYWKLNIQCPGALFTFTPAILDSAEVRGTGAATSQRFDFHTEHGHAWESAFANHVVRLGPTRTLLVKPSCLDSLPLFNECFATAFGYKHRNTFAANVIADRHAMKATYREAKGKERSLSIGTSRSTSSSRASTQTPLTLSPLLDIFDPPLDPPMPTWPPVDAFASPQADTPLLFAPLASTAASTSSLASSSQATSSTSLQALPPHTPRAVTSGGASTWAIPPSPAVAVGAVLDLNAYPHISSGNASAEEDEDDIQVIPTPDPDLRRWPDRFYICEVTQHFEWLERQSRAATNEAHKPDAFHRMLHLNEQHLLDNPNLRYKKSSYHRHLRRWTSTPHATRQRYIALGRVPEALWTVFRKDSEVPNTAEANAIYAERRGLA
ncbi:unnamed protein product [Peniophora sp. CBMAI 1063]|nr:unnamed protein product [Peniophora sp. CBMAI 1063]